MNAINPIMRYIVVIVAFCILTVHIVAPMALAVPTWSGESTILQSEFDEISTYPSVPTLNPTSRPGSDPDSVVTGFMDYDFLLYCAFSGNRVLAFWATWDGRLPVPTESYYARIWDVDHWENITHLDDVGRGGQLSWFSPTFIGGAWSLIITWNEREYADLVTPTKYHAAVWDVNTRQWYVTHQIGQSQGVPASSVDLLPRLVPDGAVVAWSHSYIGYPSPRTDFSKNVLSGMDGSLDMDGSLPVTLSSFTATPGDETVTLRWTTQSEVNNIGFNIYRSEEKDGNYTKIAFISGAGNSAMPRDYQFTNPNVEPGKTYFYYLEDVDIAGLKSKSEIIKVVVPPAKPVLPIPKEFRLLQNYPNPFNPETWIPYELAKEATVTIRIHDVKGQLVRQLDLGHQKAGSYLEKEKAAYWNGKNQTGEVVSSGIYFYTLKAGDFHATRRMVIVR